MLRKIRRNKKGDVSEYFVLLFMVFFLAVSFVVVAFVNDEFHSIVTDTELSNSPAADDVADGIDNMTTTSIQRGFVMVVFILALGLFVSSFLVRIHQVFLFLYILMLGISIFVSFILANIYQQFINVDAIANSAAGSQVMINWIMQYSGWIMLALGAISIIIVFAKISDGGRT